MNYSEISNLALAYADRSDTEVTSKIDSFLKIVEARVNRVLKTRDMSSRTTIATVLDQEYYSLPTDFAGLRDIEFRDTATSDIRVTMQYLTPDQMNIVYSNGLSGHYYTLVANKLQISPTHDSGKIIEIVYYQKLVPLTSLATTNWLSASHPDVYTFGLLVEISSFVKDAEAKALWDVRFIDAVNAIQSDDDRIRWSGTPLTIRCQ
jgi:hypothetical protein